MLRYETKTSHEVHAKTIFGRQSLIVSQEISNKDGYKTMFTPPEQMEQCIRFNNNIYT
jgi:hypothetical protein